MFFLMSSSGRAQRDPGDPISFSEEEKWVARIKRAMT
jgi:hypothetical protein